MNPSFFGLDALGCVRHFHQPLLGDQLAGGFADAVCLVLDAYECHFEVADEFHLMGRQAAALLFGERSGSLLQHLERRRGILRIVRCGVGYRGAQEFVIRTCCFQFFENELFELFQFGVTVSGFFCFCHSFNILFVIMLY